jgi:hypothetical protein
MSIVTISSMVVSKVLYPELIIKTITSLSSLSSNLINSVYYLSSLAHKDTELHDLLIKTDIVQDIIIIKSFIEDKKNDDIKHTVLNCINNLNETILELDNNINSITSKIKLHDTLWFNYFRSYDITKEKNDIPILIEKLRHRFDLFIKISSILN